MKRAFALSIALLFALTFSNSALAQVSIVPQDAEKQISDGPDLVISSIRVEPTTVSHGKNVNLFVEVKNVGSKPTTGFFEYSIFPVRFDDSVDSIKYASSEMLPPNLDIFNGIIFAIFNRTLSGLAPGSSEVYKYTIEFTRAGEHKISIRADSGNIIREINENNNVAEKSFTVIKPVPTSTPNLIVSEIIINESNNFDTRQFDVDFQASVEVISSSPTPIPGFSTRIEIIQPGVEGGPRTIINATMQKIGIEGNKHIFNYHAVNFPAGEFNIIVTADSNNAVQESDETDNTLQRIFQYLAPILESAVGPPQPLGDLSVISVPSGAEVTVDTGVRGTTPITVTNLSGGRHFVSVNLGVNQYFTYYKSVCIANMQTSQLAAVLVPINHTFSGTGTLVIDSVPQGAEVYIDNNFNGTTPLTISGLDAHGYAVKIYASDPLYYDYQEVIQLDGGQTVNLTAYLCQYQ
ncbi:MAG TPA: PEGA domain-containing protein [archaeon]|nr:PEGA domain-containing protein [archaeon]